MNYERKNNLGMLLLIGGSVLLIGALLFLPLGSVLSFLGIGVALVAAGYGFYLMTRGFSKLDVDHPDYAKWKERMENQEQKR